MNTYNRSGTCEICKHLESNRLAEIELALVLFPPKSHIARTDGGHLIVTVPYHTNNRTALSPAELLSIDLLSIATAKVLTSYCNAAMVNYQENGNWSLGDPQRNHVHMHIYGRARNASAQPFGESLTFPKRKDVSGWNPGGFSTDEQSELKRLLEDEIRSPSSTPFKEAIAKISRGSTQ